MAERGATEGRSRRGRGPGPRPPSTASKGGRAAETSPILPAS